MNAATNATVEPVLHEHSTGCKVWRRDDQSPEPQDPEVRNHVIEHHAEQGDVVMVTLDRDEFVIGRIVAHFGRRIGVAVDARSVTWVSANDVRSIWTAKD